jgi:hypothetical protein
VIIRVGMAAISFRYMTIPAGKMARRIGKMIFPAGKPAIPSGYASTPVETVTIPMSREPILVGNQKCGGHKIKTHVHLHKPAVQKIENHISIHFPNSNDGINLLFRLAAIWPFQRNVKLLL